MTLGVKRLFQKFTADTVSAAGLTGATAASRYVGATTAGPPTTGTFAVGDFVIDQTSMVIVCTAAGSPGTWKRVPPPNGLLPTGAIADTAYRPLATTASGTTTGLMRMAALHLPAGQVVTSISFAINTTALASGTHGWFALYDSSLNLLRQSTDDTSPVVAASVAKTYNLSSTFTTTYTGLHYVALMFTAGTMPTLSVVSSNTTALGYAPILGANSTGSLTTTAPNPAGALTATSGLPYAYVS